MVTTTQKTKLWILGLILAGALVFTGVITSQWNKDDPEPPAPAVVVTPTTTPPVTVTFPPEPLPAVPVVIPADNSSVGVTG